MTNIDWADMRRQLRYSASYLRVPTQDIEDVVQSALLRMWAARDRYDPAKGTLKKWAFSILLNEVRAWAKDRRKHLAGDIAGAFTVAAPERTDAPAELSGVLDLLYRISTRQAADNLVLLALGYDSWERSRLTGYTRGTTNAASWTARNALRAAAA